MTATSMAEKAWTLAPRVSAQIRFQTTSHMSVTKPVSIAASAMNGAGGGVEPSVRTVRASGEATCGGTRTRWPSTATARPTAMLSSAPSHSGPSRPRVGTSQKPPRNAPAAAPAALVA